MSAFDNLKQAHQAALALHQQYQKLEAAKEQLFADGANEGEPENMPAIIRKMEALKPMIAELVSNGQRLESQVDAAYAAVDAEASPLHDEASDKCSDISAFAADWPDEIQEMINDFTEWMRDAMDEKSNPAVEAKPGAHKLYG